VRDTATKRETSAWDDAINSPCGHSLLRQISTERNFQFPRPIWPKVHHFVLVRWEDTVDDTRLYSKKENGIGEILGTRTIQFDSDLVTLRWNCTASFFPIEIRENQNITLRKKSGRRTVYVIRLLFHSHASPYLRVVQCVSHLPFLAFTLITS